MSIPLDGLSSGLDTTSLINQLMQLERLPQTRLLQKRTKAQQMITAYQGLNSKLAALRDASRTVAAPDGWKAMKATSSAPTVATASAATGALSGSLAFTVDQLATAGALISSGSVSSTSAIISSGPLLLSTGAGALGFSNLSAGAGLAFGDHQITVTQESTAASKSGTTALAASTVVGPGNDSIDVEVDGIAATWVLAHGTYSQTELADAVATAAAGAVTASVDASGRLVITTLDEGSAASLQVTGGNLLAGLGFTADAVAIAGVDGKVDVDGTETVINDVRAGVVVALGAPSGTISATLAGGIRNGSITATNIDTGDGRLSTVVEAINVAGAGMTATAIQTGTSTFRLQLASTTTGAAGMVSLDPDSFASLGTLTTLTQAQDAAITIGSGPGAFTVTSSSNAFTGLLQGTTVNVVATGSATVTVGQDKELLANRVSGLVDVANAALAEITRLTKYDPQTGSAGLLMSSFGVRQLKQSIMDSLTTGVSSSGLVSVANAGVSVTKTGTLTFDRATFLSAVTDDPDAVAALFRQGGTSTDPAVALVSAADRTVAGTYDVEITVAAEQATWSGTAPTGGVIAAAETIELTVGSSSITYAAAAGETLESIAAGINQLSADSSLGLVVTVEGVPGAEQLVVSTTSYGANATFEIITSVTGADQTGLATTPGTPPVGVDVVGTINGVAATGVGQILTAPADDAALAGLALRITAAAAGALGQFTYSPGVAQRLASRTNEAVDSVSGTIISAIEGREREMANLDDQIDQWDTRLEARELALRRKFTAMEVALSQAQAQSSWLQSQLAGMQANSAAARR